MIINNKKLRRKMGIINVQNKNEKEREKFI